jgi:hypothetical protein
VKAHAVALVAVAITKRVIEIDTGIASNVTAEVL